MTTALVAAAAALAAVVKGMLGMGFPPVATPLITTLVGAQTAVVSVAIPGFLQNAVQAWGGRAHLRDIRSLTPLLAMLIVGSLLGAYLLTVLPVHLVTLLVGVSVMIYAGLALLRILRGRRLRWRHRDVRADPRGLPRRDATRQVPVHRGDRFAPLRRPGAAADRLRDARPLHARKADAVGDHAAARRARLCARDRDPFTREPGGVRRRGPMGVAADRAQAGDRRLAVTAAASGGPQRLRNRHRWNV
ncbi:MAG: hypothetical protein DMD81_25300 [Candidatus Rokuibacteriota bacterium]|nr:MAG: hypothetical protein DMD81_25300 [Candidatus Rokubacteria bacterium]